MCLRSIHAIYTPSEPHVPLQDQDGNDPAEVARSSAAHSGETIAEKDVLWNVAYFWWRIVQMGHQRSEVCSERMRDRQSTNTETLLYFTARPEIIITQIQNGGFLCGMLVKVNRYLETIIVPY